MEAVNASCVCFITSCRSIDLLKTMRPSWQGLKGSTYGWMARGDLGTSRRMDVCLDRGQMGVAV